MKGTSIIKKVNTNTKGTEPCMPINCYIHNIIYILVPLIIWIKIKLMTLTLNAIRQ